MQDSTVSNSPSLDTLFLKEVLSMLDDAMQYAGDQGDKQAEQEFANYYNTIEAKLKRGDAIDSEARDIARHAMRSLPQV